MNHLQNDKRTIAWIIKPLGEGVKARRATPSCCTRS